MKIFILIIFMILFGILGRTIAKDKGFSDSGISSLIFLGILTGPFIILARLLPSQIKKFTCPNCNIQFTLSKKATKGACPNCNTLFNIK